MLKKSIFTRRNFLKATGFAGVAAVAGSVLAPHHVQAQPVQVNAKADPVKVMRAFRGRMFFANILDFNTLSEAVERIYPKDETGPGAKELAVPFFIDNQLAGAYGYNAREYLAAPHFVGASTQGPQSSLQRKDIFLQGINALNRQANASHGRDFPELADAQKDAILKMCEEGKIETAGFTSSEFFALLKFLVLAGVYSDPIYNGNNNMDGWRMKKYPGHQPGYTKVVANKKFDRIEPMSLADMQ